MSAERTLAGMIMRDSTAFSRTQVTENHISDLVVKTLWRAFTEMDAAGITIDELSLADHMSETHLHAVGGLAGLMEISGAVGTTANLGYYADRVRDNYLAREVKRKASELLEQDSEASGVELLSMLSAHQNALQGCLSGERRTLGAVVTQEYNTLLTGPTGALGVPTGLGVDRWIPGGVPRGKVWTIFADTGTFKTTAVNQFMFNAAELGFKGLLVPLEDGDELTAHRWLSRKTGVHYGRIAGGVCNDAERQKVRLLAPGEWSCLENIRSCDGIEPRIENIIREVAAAKAQGGLDFVVVDYMQLLEGRGKAMDIITDAMKKAANAAKRYDVVWVFLSQKNDKSLDRKDPRPHLGDLFGSASMKQMSKTVFALFRPSEHWPKPTANHPLHGMYHKMIERLPSGEEIYKNTIELWMCKNVLGKKRSMQLLVAKPEQGILDPLNTEGWL